MKKISLILLFLFSLTLNACNQGSNDSLDSFESVSESFESESTSSESISESKSESESESEFIPQTTNFNTPNPNAKKVSIKTLVDKGKTSDSKNLYSITGYVQFPYNYTFGNFDIVDETLTRDRDRVYQIIVAEYDGVVRSATQAELWLGKLNIAKGGAELEDLAKLYASALDKKIKGYAEAGKNDPETSALYEAFNEISRSGK